MLRAYLDSSGKRERKHGYLTLAAVVANDEMWAEFDTAWKKILEEHVPKASYIHMREILRLKDGFDSALGWDSKSAFDVATKCVAYMSHLDKKRFHIFYCSVDLFAWRKLRAETYELPDPVDMCNKYCSETVVGWYLNSYPGVIDTSTDNLKYFFDRSEPFKKPFEDKWNYEKNWAEEIGEQSCWHLIDDVSAVDMKKTPGIQAADIIAWGVNREVTQKDGKLGFHLAEVIRQVIPSHHIVWDEAKMRGQYKPLIYLP